MGLPAYVAPKDKLGHRGEVSGLFACHLDCCDVPSHVPAISTQHLALPSATFSLQVSDVGILSHEATTSGTEYMLQVLQLIMPSPSQGQLRVSGRSQRQETGMAIHLGMKMWESRCGDDATICV